MMARQPFLWSLVVVLANPAYAQPGEQPTGPTPEEIEARMAQKRSALAKLNAILKKEPTVKEVQDATLHFYKLEPERLAKMADATHWKALLPEFEGGIDNSTGKNFNYTKDGFFPVLPSPPENPNPGNFKERTEGTSDSFLWRIRAVWNLDRLVFNSEELDVKSLNSIEENLVREVTTLFFSRRRQLASLLISAPEDPEELYYEKLKLEEATATIDALTGGMFAKRAFKGLSDQDQ